MAAVRDAERPYLVTAQKITAAYIADAYLGKPLTKDRLEKAKALAQRSKIEWVAVESAIRTKARDVLAQFERQDA